MVATDTRESDVSRRRKTTQRSPGRTRRRWIIAVVIGLIVIWLVGALFLLVRGAVTAASGVNKLERARSSLSADQLIEPGAELPSELTAAEADLRQAHDTYSGIWLAPVRLLPVVGRQVRSASAMSLAGADLAGLSEDVYETTQEIFADGSEAAWANPADRVSTIERVGELAAASSTNLREIELGPDDALFGFLDSARRNLASELDATAVSLDRAAAASQATAGLLQGPSRYLFVAANNAEMRGGSGMFLSLGVLEAANGELTVSGMESVEYVDVPSGVVGVDADVAALWGYLEPDHEWRSLATTPRFEVTAEQAAQMWEAAGRGPVDGVLLADVEAMHALVKATGPIKLESERIGAKRVNEFLLTEQYREFDQQIDARRDRLADLAVAAIAAVDSGDFDPVKLVRGLQTAVGGRHIMFWSKDARVQADWEQAGVAGTVGPDALMVSVLNQGGNKLDPYLNVDADLAVDSGGAGAATTGVLRLTMSNGVAEGEPRYIAGPHPASGVGEGVYRGLVTINVPHWFKDVRFADDHQFNFGGPDGETYQYVFEVQIPRGASETAELEFTLPDSGELTVLPSTRMPALNWTSTADGDLDDWQDEEAHDVRW